MAARPGDESILQKSKHVNYWKRCLKTFLPAPYVQYDSNRMTLAFFTVSALDLLDSLESSTTAQERSDYCEWVYSCQHPDGGFRGYPTVDLIEEENKWNRAWNPATVPSTYFALATLAILGDDLSKVKRRDCLQWLKHMQRPDGSFGEFLNHDANIEGGRDTRYCYCATIVRWILRGDTLGGSEDIDVGRLVSYINKLEAFDGGIAEAPFQEAQAGFTYCAIGTLYFLNHLSVQADTRQAPGGLTNLPLTLHWLASRLVIVSNGEDGDDNLHSDDEQVLPSSSSMQDVLRNPFLCTGMNGRANKDADTCYVFWVGGCLDILGQSSLIAAAPTRRYLLDKTQHMVGGFGKHTGFPPDIYHSYLGLAALSIIGDDQVKPLSSALCFSLDAKSKLENLAWRREITSMNQGRMQ